MGKGMVQSRKKLVRLCIMLSMILICAFSSFAYTDSNSDSSPQPKALNHTGVYSLRQIDPDLTGRGVKFAVVCRSITYIDGEPQNDYRPNIEHNCFKTGNLEFKDQGQLPAGISQHSTAACSILLGEDPYAFNEQLGEFYYEGVAPQAKAEVYELWHFLTNNVFPLKPPDADIITASIGSQFEDWWTRGIEAMAEHFGITVVAGIGNGSNAHDSVLYPAAGSNIIGVGVVDSINTDNPAINLANFSLAYPQHSSAGPTEDGRCKPDIVAPGNCLAADVNDPENYNPTGNWSSYSTPIVAGTVGLLVQKAKQDSALSSAVSSEGGNCVIKTILLNSATKLPFWHKGRLTKEDDHLAPLDFIQGAGMLNALGAYELLLAGQYAPGNCPTNGWDLNQLNKKTLEKSYNITLTEPADKFITITAVWNRHFDSVYPFNPKPKIDADLRVEIWAVDPQNADNDYLLDYSDSSIDNVEHIYCQADPNYIEYEIVVSYSNISEPNQIFPSQTYALAWNTSPKAQTQDNNNISWYDLNADGVVNEKDLGALVDNMLNSKKTTDNYLIGDINTDGAIDANDLQIFMNYQKSQTNQNTSS